MSRLPTPGSDDGQWGMLLNDYLSVSLGTDGTLKTSAIPDAAAGTKGKIQLAGDLGGTADAPTVPGLAAKANDTAVVHVTGNETVVGIKAFSSSPTVPTPTNAGDAANKSYVDGVASAGAPDATTTTKGLVQLAGDLSGTASAPTVPGLAATEKTANKGAASGYAPLDGSSKVPIANLPVGTTGTTVAVGNDSRITGAVQSSIVTTKGDLIAASGAATIARVGVGSDGKVLTADSAQVSGLAWSTPSATDTNAVHHGDLFLNVKDYGAIGDGAADDTTAIQNAINAGAATAISSTSAGATIYFPAGTYKISAALTLGASSLTLRGAGFRSTTVRQVTSGANGFFAQDRREFVFSNMKIQGPGTGTADGIYLAASGSNAVFDCQFTNLLITTFGRHGIHTEDLCTSMFAHVRIDSCGSDGFHLSDNGTSSLGGTSVSMISCYANACGGAGYYLDALKYTSLSGCATDTCDYGYFINRCSGISLNGCGVESTTGTHAHGFMIANGTTSLTLNACWSTNIASSTGVGYNIVNNGGSGCSRILISGCRIQGGIAPLYSAHLDSNCQVVFVGFQAHPSSGMDILGNAQFISHENLGLTAYGQAPASGDEPFVAWLPDTVSYGYGTSVRADTVRRWAVRSDGTTEWGTGALARDTNLYRSAASTLRTDSTFVAANVNVGSPSSAAKIYASYADSGTQAVGFQMQETAGTANGTAMQIMQAAGTSKRVMDVMVTGDTSRRLSINAAGTITFGSGTALDTNVYRSAADVLATDDDLAIRTAGKGIQVKEGSNAKMGTATLTGGTVTISNTSVTASSRIFLTTYIASGTVGALYVSAKIAGTSFSVTSTSGSDTSTFNYLIVEPAA